MDHHSQFLILQLVHSNKGLVSSGVMSCQTRVAWDLIGRFNQVGDSIRNRGLYILSVGGSIRE